MSKTKDKTDVFKQGNITITFNLQDEDFNKVAYIFIEDDNTEIAYYKREFSSVFNAVHYQNFIKKFLSNPEYRKSYTIGGGWEGVIIDKIKDDIHPNCKSKINFINSTKKTLKFKDFASLKTYGRDKFSGIKIEELKKIIPEKDFEKIKDEFEDEKYILYTARWTARGLFVDHAIRKVKTDLEIEKNIRE